MHEITALTAADYLRQSGRVPDKVEIDVRELSGGVSNIVLRVEIRGKPPFVIKQCRERLRVAMDWRACRIGCGVGRRHAEAARISEVEERG